MNEKNIRGFTLIEVVLAIAVGLIIIAGVSVGYTYAKRAAIIDNQQKNVTALKVWAERTVAQSEAFVGTGHAANTACGTFCPPQINMPNLLRQADSLPSLKYDPYNGTDRAAWNATNNGALYPCTVSGTNITNSSCVWTVNNLAGGRTISTTSAPGAGSALVYFSGRAFSDPFVVTLANGTQRTFYGFVFIETDLDGNIVAADGGQNPNPTP